MVSIDFLAELNVYGIGSTVTVTVCSSCQMLFVGLSKGERRRYFQFRMGNAMEEQRQRERKMGSHKNDSIYGAVYFMPIIERNRTSNSNNNSRTRTEKNSANVIINVAPNILASKPSEFFRMELSERNDLVSMSCDFEFFRF